MRSFFGLALLCCLATNLEAQTGIECINNGVDWSEKHEPDKAIASFTEALRRLDPSDTLSISTAYGNRGAIWDEKNQFVKALSDLNRAIAINPNLGLAYFNRGQLWQHTGEYDKSLADFNRALAVDPSFAKAYMGLSLVYSTCPYKKYRDGQKAFENANRAYQLIGATSETLTCLAAAYMENGDYQHAKEWEAKVLSTCKTGEDIVASTTRFILYGDKMPFRRQPVTSLTFLAETVVEKKGKSIPKEFTQVFNLSTTKDERWACQTIDQSGGGKKIIIVREHDYPSSKDQQLLFDQVPTDLIFVNAVRKGEAYAYQTSENRKLVRALYLGDNDPRTISNGEAGFQAELTYWLNWKKAEAKKKEAIDVRAKEKRKK